MDVGTCPHQVLAATLTLSQPGGQIKPTLYWCPHQVLKATGAPVAGKNRWWDHKGAIVLRWQPSYHKRSFDFTDYTFQVLSEQTIELLLLATKHKPGSLMSAF